MRLINVMGAPGVGKSTFSAGLFSQMKRNQFDVEYVTEFAKEKVWERNSLALQCQPYITGTQLFNLTRLQDQVEYVITDSPIILGCLYDKKYPESYRQSLIDTHKTFKSYNILLELDDKRDFSNTGRIHDQSQSLEIQRDLKFLLDSNGIVYNRVDQYIPDFESICQDIQSFFGPK